MMYLFNMWVPGLVSLEMSISYILAIIATPVVLGIFSYIHVGNSKVVFYLIETVFLVMFLLFTPLSVASIYIIISLTSILISYYAEPDFVWYKILNSS